ncbi:Chromo domain-containing protein [Balamuthia mandrillaris]
MSDDNKRSTQHWDDLSPAELRLLIKKEQASIQHLKVTGDELLESLHNHQTINKDETFAHLTTIKRELYSTEQRIQELDHALQQAEQKDSQYLFKQLNSLELQTSNISFLVEAVDVLLKCTNKSVFERYESIITNTITRVDKWFNTLTCLMNNITDHLECIKLNQVVIAQWQQHSEPEKVKEGEESLFFNSPPHVADTPYHAADTPFIAPVIFPFSMTYLSGLSFIFLNSDWSAWKKTGNTKLIFGVDKIDRRATSAPLPPSSPSPSLALPPSGTNQPSTNVLDATTKQEFMEAVHYAWETQGNIELAAINLNALLHPGDASDTATDVPNPAVTSEAIHMEGLDTDDDDDVEDDCEDKVEPSIMAPILLNHQCATAFIDSGASHSFISLAAAEKYLHPASCEHHHTVISHIDDMEITLGDRFTTCVTRRMAHVCINCGSRKLHHHFFIMPLQGEHEILFGRDITRHISVGLFSLSVHYPLPSEREEFKEDDSNISNKDKCVELPFPPNTARKITKGIHDVLQCNQQVPHGPSSSLPESVIYLNTSDAKPVFHKQYTIYEKVAKYLANVEKHFNATNKIIHFSPGDKVMLKNSLTNSKTDPKFLGPFIIHHCTDDRAYILQEITGNILPDKVPPSAFKPVDPNTPFNNEHFKVEKVLDHDGPPSDCYYLVKWKGYPDSDNSWVVAKDFGSQRPITTYWGKKYPKKRHKQR